MDLRQRPGLRLWNLKLGTWNVRTLYRAGAFNELRSELSQCEMDMVALQEVRWLKSGTVRGNDYAIFYSGSEVKHELGTAFIVSTKLLGAVLDFQPVSNRICILRVKGRFFNISMINAHAPTEDKDEEEKDNFYDQLERVYDQCPSHDIKIVMGDFNAQVGREREYIPTIGRHSLHDHTNDNGERMINFAAAKSMIVMSTVFPHKDIHKQTWCSPDQVTTNQIDHFLITSRHRSSVQDVRSFRGPNVDSDHYLVVMKMKQRIHRCPKKRNGRGQPKWNAQKLKLHRINEDFRQKTDGRMGSLAAEVGADRSIEDKWQGIKKVFVEVAEEVVGKKDRSARKTWYDEDCEIAIRERNEKRQKYLQRRTRQSALEYSESRKVAKKLIKDKKRAAINREIEEIENSGSVTDNRKFYKRISEFRKKGDRKNGMLRDEENKLVISGDEIAERWGRHFQTLLNERRIVEPDADTVEQRPYPAGQQDDDLEEVTPPELEDIYEIIARLKRDKSPGLDGIPAEFLKAGGDTVIKEVYNLISQIWVEERMPEDWTEGAIVPIYKKGDPTQCSNYRGISLLSVTYKVLAIALYNRLVPYVENKLGDYQGGFRKGKSTTDQIFVLRQLQEKMREHGITMWMLFVDFKAAYDTVQRRGLMKAMEEMMLPQKLIRLTEMTLRESSSLVLACGNRSVPFNIENGLRQGDPLSPLLFNCLLHRVVKNADVDLGGSILNKTSQILAYADDVAIIGRSLAALKNVFMSLEREAKKVGLHVNEDKTKIMVARRKKPLRQPAQYVVGDYSFETVSSFPYLGSVINDNGDEGEEIKKRILAGNKAYYSVSRLIRSRVVSRGSKIKIYRTLIRPVVTYGCETWTLNKVSCEKLDRFERKVLRRIFGPIRENGNWRIRKNSEIYALYKEGTITSFVRCQRLKWYGHVSRMPDASIPKKALMGSMSASRPRGRPKTRWIDNARADMKRLGIGARVVHDREQWTRRIEQAKDRLGL